MVTAKLYLPDFIVRRWQNNKAEFTLFYYASVSTTSSLAIGFLEVQKYNSLVLRVK
jgi:hypothetical protein